MKDMPTSNFILFGAILGLSSCDLNLEKIRSDMGIKQDTLTEFSIVKVDSVLIESTVEQTDTIKSASKIYAETVNSTVTILTDNDHLGSGFFVAPNLIVTNFHVIRNSSDVRIKLNNSGKFYRINGYVAVNKSDDLIILETDDIEGEKLQLSNRELTVGEKIYVIGSPDGLPATISDGIISNVRNFTDNSYVQITAPISPGSSGGPVLNEYGEVIGVSVMYFKESQNVNFAVPVQSLKTLLAFKRPFASDIRNLLEAPPSGSEPQETTDDGINE